MAKTLRLMLLLAFTAFVADAAPAAPEAKCTGRIPCRICNKVDFHCSEDARAFNHACREHTLDDVKAAGLSAEQQGYYQQYCGSGGPAGSTPRMPTQQEIRDNLQEILGTKPADIRAIHRAGEDARSAGQLVEGQAAAKRAADAAVRAHDVDEDLMLGIEDEDELPTVALIQPPAKPKPPPRLQLQPVPPVIAATRDLVLQVDDIAGNGECKFEWKATGSLVLHPSPPILPGGATRSTAVFQATKLGDGGVEVACRQKDGKLVERKTGKVRVQPPILFVHGIDSNAATWNAVRNELVTRGFVPGQTLTKGGSEATSGDFYMCSFNLNTGDWYQEAPELSSFIDRIRARMKVNGPKPPVILVAHSMGGLASRAYLQGNAGPSPQEAGQRVGALVTIGTPHRGSFMAQLHETEWALKKGLTLWKTVFEGGATPKGIEALAVTSPQIKRLNADAGKMSASVKHVSIVTVVAPRDAEAFRAILPTMLHAKSAAMSIGALALAPSGMAVPDVLADVVKDPKHPLADALPTLFARSDSLVDVSSQNLNSVLPGRSKLIFGGTAEHLEQTARTDLVFQGLAETGFFPDLSSLPQSVCWSASGVPEVGIKPTNARLFGAVGDGYANLKSEDFLTSAALNSLDAAIAFSPLPDNVETPAMLAMAAGKGALTSIDTARPAAHAANDAYLARATALREKEKEILELERAGKITKQEARRRRDLLRAEAKALWWKDPEARFQEKGPVELMVSGKAGEAGAIAAAASLAGDAAASGISADTVKGRLGSYLAGEAVESMSERALTGGDPSSGPAASLVPTCGGVR